MKKALVFLSAVILLAALAIPAFAEFELTDFTIPETGVHFAFDGNADDEFGNLKGELVGDPTFMEGHDGKADGAIYFDDDTQYVGLYKRVALGDYTASFWVWLEDNPSYNFLCTSMEGSLRAMQNPSQEVGSTINGVVDNFSAYTAPIETWTMLTFVYDSAEETTNIYADGEYVDSVYGALALPLTTIGNECAEQKGWQTYPFQAIDDTWFFGRMLTDPEIRSLFATNSIANAADYEGAAAAAPAAEAPAAEAAPAAEGYPSSGFTPKEGSQLVFGEVIGLELGWDGTEACGKNAAFDGDPKTFFDPLGTGDGWAGIDAGSEFTLTSILIHPRDGQLPRFNGGTIEGSMDPEFENAVTVWSSTEEATEFKWYEIDQSDFDEVGSFRYYRYINWTNHGDVGDIELYGYASDGDYEKQEAARQEAAAKAAEEAAAKKAEAEAAKAAEAEAKAAEEAAKAAEEAAAAAAEEAVEAAEGAAEEVAEEAKSGCGSVIGGGMIVLLTILGCGWIVRRKD